MAFVALAVGACGTPDEEAKPRPLSEEPRKLDPGTYRTEEFEPAFSFEVDGGWATNSLPESSDALLLTRGHETAGLGFANLEGAHFYKPTNTGTPYMTDVPKDLVGWFQEHPYLETQGTDPVEVGGVEGVRTDVVVGDLPRGLSDECGSGCVPLFRFSSGGLPLVLFEEDKARVNVLEDVRGETVITGFDIRADEFDEHAPEAQKVIDTVRWRGG